MTSPAVGYTHPHGVPDSDLYGYLAEFESPQALVDAAEAVQKAGYTKTDAFTPFPVPEVDDALGIRRSILPWIILGMGITGGTLGFAMQYFANVVHYPLNIGGRPVNSWPMFIPITFELTILFSAFTAGIAMLLMNGFPKHYHPVFNVPSFSRASTSSFFLCIEETDENFDRVKTREFLQSLNPVEVSDIAP
jgi:hypothetical protein